MQVILQRLAREPAALGALLASVLPALVVLGILSMDEQAIGAIVVMVNSTMGLVLRLLVTPGTQPPGNRSPLDAARG